MKSLLDYYWEDGKLKLRPENSIDPNLDCREEADVNIVLIKGKDFYMECVWLCPTHLDHCVMKHHSHGDCVCKRGWRCRLARWIECWSHYLKTGVWLGNR